MSSLELSIDGVGEWAVVNGPTWTIGGPDGGADLEFLAPLPKTAAAIEWTGDCYRIRTGEGTKGLKNGQTISLARGVTLLFRRPHPWSPAATLTPTGVRPRDNMDGLVMWAGPCVLGPDTDSHIVCGNWSESVVLFEWPDGPRWKRIAAGGGRAGETVNLLGLPTLIETGDGRVHVRGAGRRLQSTR